MAHRKVAEYGESGWLMSERRGFRGPRYLVSGADWIPGTASTPVSLSHQSDEA